MTAENRRNTLVLSLAIAVIIIVTSIAYYPSVKNGFVWDDEGYILQNHYIKQMSLDHLKTILTAPIMSNYHPLIIVSYSWEYFLFKLNPAPYHVINIIVHLVNCALVFYFIMRLSRSIPVAFITALLFGTHPLHVESVAWISGLKDVLYTSFYFLSLICYLSYLNKTPNRKYYCYALFFFALSLLSKPMAVTLPLVLLLVDYLEQRRFQYPALVEKIPFFLLSLACGIITILVQSGVSHQGMGFPASFFVACRGLLFYLYKTVLPINLSCLYRYPLNSSVFSEIEYVFAPIGVMVLALAVFYSRRYSKKAVWGGLFYLFTLLPVIQLLPVGLAVASDRYTYVPLIGAFYVFSEIIVWTWQNKLRNHRYLRVVSIILLMAIAAQLVLLTNGRCKVWRDGVSLWTNVIERDTHSGAAYNNRGNEYLRLGEREKALQDFLAAIQITPNYSAALGNVCYTYFLKGDMEKAKGYCTTALEIDPRLENTYAVLGDIYLRTDTSVAIEMYKKSVALSPEFSAGYSRLCKAYLALQSLDEAFPVCSRAVELDPGNAAFCGSLGNVYLHSVQYGRALAFYEKALLANPFMPDIHYNVAVVYYHLGHPDLSLKHLNIASSLGYKVDPEFQYLVERNQAVPPALTK